MLNKWAAATNSRLFPGNKLKAVREKQRAAELEFCGYRRNETKRAYDEGNFGDTYGAEKLFSELLGPLTDAITDYCNLIISTRVRNVPEYVPILFSLPPSKTAAIVLRVLFSTVCGGLPLNTMVVTLAKSIANFMHLEYQIDTWDKQEKAEGRPGRKEFMKRYPNPGVRVLSDWVHSHKIKIEKTEQVYRTKRCAIAAGLVLLRGILVPTFPNVFCLGKYPQKNGMAITVKFTDEMLRKLFSNEYLGSPFAGPGMPMFCVPDDWELVETNKKFPVSYLKEL